jgi:hypothetical protein
MDRGTLQASGVVLSAAVGAVASAWVLLAIAGRRSSPRTRRMLARAAIAMAAAASFAVTAAVLWT